MNGPGFLAVAIQPGPDTEHAAFEDWYKTEHGPLRLRLPFITTGDRYAARDGCKPAWWAIYDVTDLAYLEQRIYTRLRAERSRREQDVMRTFKSLDRKIYSLISSHGAIPGRAAPVSVAVSIRIAEADVEAYNALYETEHIALLSKLPGWLRSRRFRLEQPGLQGMPPPGQVEFLALHDFADDAGEQGENAVNAAVLVAEERTPGMAAVAQKFLWQERRAWSHYLSFDALQEPPSSVITTDGAVLQYELQGRAADPVIVLVNSILTDFHIWDGVAAALLAGVAGTTYRVLRYNPRGYAPPDDKSNPTTFDRLADDLEYLLQRLEIPRAHAVVGVSMGGVTALSFAIRYPALLRKYVACDCNVAASPANSAAWGARIELARVEGMPALAKATVERWFLPAHHGSAEVQKTLAMVAQAHPEGFAQSTYALCNYDLTAELAKITAPGLLVAGAGDGKIPQAMQAFGIADARYVEIPDAGHLPMLENHEAFMEALAGFL